MMTEEVRQFDDSLRDDGDAEKRLTTGVMTEIKVNGQAYTFSVASVRLTQKIHDHHVLAVRIHNGDLSGGSEEISLSKAQGFLGSALTVNIVPSDGITDASLQLSFTGIVTAVRFVSDIGHANDVIIIAKSPTVGMDSGARNAMFHEMSVENIISSILGAHSLSRDKLTVASATSAYVIQYRETDYDFVLRMASGVGSYAWYNGARFTVSPAGTADAVDLVGNMSLGAFSVEIGTAPVKFASAAYDPVGDKVLSSNSKKPAASDVASKSPAASEEIYGQEGFIDGGATSDMAGLDKMLEGAAKRAAGNMVHCYGQSCIPALCVGLAANVTQMGGVDGHYWIEEVEHVVNEDGYYNTFVGVPVSTAQPRPRRSQPPLTQLQSAVVTDNNDPEGLGRVKVKYRWDEDLETPWLRYVAPHAGEEYGWFSLPEVDDEVLVGFEQGNPARPVALGSMYNGTKKPAMTDSGGENNFKGMVTRTGHKILLSDESGKEMISIVTKDEKCQIIMDVAKKSITIESEGDISLKGDNITIEAAKELSLESGTDMKEKAGTNFKAEAGANLDIKGTGQVNVKGAMINLN